MHTETSISWTISLASLGPFCGLFCYPFLDLSVITIASLMKLKLRDSEPSLY